MYAFALAAAFVYLHHSFLARPALPSDQRRSCLRQVPVTYEPSRVATTKSLFSRPAHEVARKKGVCFI